MEGVYKMTDKEFLYEKEIDCPCCKGKFIIQKIRSSRLKMLKKDEDLLVYYENINPSKYAIRVCPKCGYAASERKYEVIKKSDIIKIKENITSRWEPQEYGGVRNVEQAINSFKLALLQGDILGYSNLDMGKICLSIGWLYRGYKYKEEMRFLKFARDKFIKAYENESLINTEMDDTKLSYLIAELSRRIGDIEEAKRWFVASISLPGMRMNRVLDTLAREQWAIVKEMDKAA